MQIQFTKEGITNYMIVPWEGEWKDGYESRLFQYHEVPHFLRYEIRQLNGDTSLYYRLQCHTSLSSVMGHLPFTYERVRNMVISMMEAMEELEEYLLEMDGIVWNCDAIFVNVETGRLQFCYYPDSGEMQGDLRTVITEILEQVDKKQDRIVLLLMRFYDLVTEQNLTREFLEKFREEMGLGHQQKAVHAEETYHKMCGNSESGLEDGHKERNMDMQEPYVVEHNPKIERGNWKNTCMKIAIAMVAVADMMLLIGFVADVISLYYIRYLFMGMVILIILTILYMQNGEDESPDQIMQEYFAKAAEQTGEQKNAPASNPERSDERKVSAKNLFSEDVQPKEPEGKEMGETSLLTETEEATPQPLVEVHHEKPLRLEAMEKDRYPDIILQKGNVVIGSMAEGCGYVLKERGVSRLHAKIMEKADGIYLLDLNSTNGTYLNGERIDGGKDYKLEKGDMVTFAKCEFYVV